MKQKYRIWKKEESKELLIQEYAVITSESRKKKIPGLLIDEDFSLLCEQTYRADDVKKATAQGKEELILFLRNQHFYPTGIYINLIADTVTSMYAAKGEQHEDLIFDDKDVQLGAPPEAEIGALTEVEEDINEDDQAENIDDLLEDDSPIAKDDATAKIKPEHLDEE
jgi:hypothetical protein